MIKQLCCSFLMFMLVVNMLQAQQLPLFTQYRESQGIINPAAVSNSYFLYENNTLFGASYRRQWVGDKRTPHTQYIRGEYLHDKNVVGLLAGGYLMNDQAGRFGLTGIYGRIAGIISPDIENSGMSIGLSIGAVQYRLDLENARVNTPDEVLLSGQEMRLSPDVGFGIFVYNRLFGGWVDEDMTYLGISVPQVLGREVVFRDSLASEFKVRRVQHFYGTLGYIKNLNDDFSFIECSVWVKYVNHVPLNVDVNIRYQIQDILWIGGGWNTAKTLHLEAGFLVGENHNYKVGYSFDVPYSRIKPYYGNSHEINMTVALGSSRYGW